MASSSKIPFGAVKIEISSDSETESDPLYRDGVPPFGPPLRIPITKAQATYKQPLMIHAWFVQKWLDKTMPNQVLLLKKGSKDMKRYPAKWLWQTNGLLSCYLGGNSPGGWYQFAVDSDIKEGDENWIEPTIKKDEFEITIFRGGR